MIGKDVAQAVINACLRADYIYEADIPEDEAGRLDLAQHCIDECGKLAGTGVSNDTVVEVLRLAELDGSLEGSGEGRMEDAAQAPPDLSSSVDEEPVTPEEDTTPPSADSEHSPSQADPSGSLDEGETQEVQEDRTPRVDSKSSSGTPQEELPIPAEIEGDVPGMPRDITKASADEIRRLHGAYGACLSRATYLVSIASADVRNASHLRDAAYRKRLNAIRTKARAVGEKLTNSEAEALALEDAEVVGWEERLRHEENRLDQLKALKEIYKGNVDRLSREASMRQDEWLRSGGGRRS